MDEGAGGGVGDGRRRHGVMERGGAEDFAAALHVAKVAALATANWVAVVANEMIGGKAAEASDGWFAEARWGRLK